MIDAYEALRQAWEAVGGEPQAVEAVDLTGAEPALPSSFAVGALAQASIASAGLAAAEVWRRRTGQTQKVAVDMRHAAVECRSERYLHIGGTPAGRFRDALAGIYRCGDGRWVRPQLTYPHHHERFLTLIGCDPKATTPEDLARALLAWKAEELETEATQVGGVATASRTFAEWDAHLQGRAVAGLPLVIVEKIADAPPRPLPPDPARPLSGVRALDLTHIISGPVAGRALAAHGAEVLKVTGPGMPGVRILDIDTGRGKRACHLNLRAGEERRRLRELLGQADTLVQSYRPGALAGLGFGPRDAARFRPGIVYASLSAYGEAGPWAGRRGFDSLTQTASGFNLAEAQAAGEESPRELPFQALDHASGYLLAAGIMVALVRRAEEGGSWHVRAALARTGLWLRSFGRLEDGLKTPEMGHADVADLMEESESGFGILRAVRHAARLSLTPPRWDLPSMPLGSHPAEWRADPDAGRAL